MATAFHRLFERLRPQPLPSPEEAFHPDAPPPQSSLPSGNEAERYAVRLERPVSLPQVGRYLVASDAPPAPARLEKSERPLLLGASIAFIDEELNTRGEHPLLREMKAQAQWFQHFQSQERYEYPEQRQAKEELAVHAPISVHSPQLPHITLEALPPLLGHQRVTLTVSHPGPLELRIQPQQANVSLEIADMQPGRWQANTLWVEAGSYEICFRLHSAEAHYCGVEIQIEGDASPLATSAATFPVQRQEAAPNAWIDGVPESWREVVSHIAAHGAIDEQALIQMLGGPGSGVRKARRFASALSEWGQNLPFRLEITTTQAGREYRKVG